MNGLSSWWVLLAALVGHGGLHIGIYNRINAFGWPRWQIKTLVALFFLNTLAIPLIVAVTQSDALRLVLLSHASWELLDPWVRGYGGVCLAAWGFLGGPWLLWRPLFGVEWVDAPRHVRRVQVERAVGRRLPLTAKARFESRLPLNQLLQLSIEEIELPVAGLPSKLEGYRIAHLSDIHLTGEIHPDYARYAVEQATRWRPDLMALTGDIIDKQACIDWLTEIFAPAEATDGCYFILGNHDTRIADSWETRRAMDRAGWIDLGSQVSRHRLAGVEVDLLGNEFPWFERPAVSRWDAEFRLLLSHSPDQFGWARRQGIELMLAGHTHGGQGRLPLAGPILSPSKHGSRYASGDFYRPPTTMHVSRGLGGVHLMRINCPPELSLLTLRPA